MFKCSSETGNERRTNAYFEVTGYAINLTAVRNRQEAIATLIYFLMDKAQGSRVCLTLVSMQRIGCSSDRSVKRVRALPYT